MRFAGLGFQVPGSGFRIPGFEHRVSGFGSWVWGLGFSLSGFGFRVLGFWVRSYLVRDKDEVGDEIFVDLIRNPRKRSVFRITLPTDYFMS